MNGGGGLLFGGDPCPKKGAAIAEAHRRLGTTSILLTLISSPLGVTLEAIEAVRELLSAGAGVLGLHLEGPFINPARAGAHDLRFIRGATDREIGEILRRGEGVVRMMTVAPEVLSEPQVRRIAESGIVVSAGHTEADRAQMARFVEAGGRMVTHLYNAMPQMEARRPGVVGAALEDERLWAGIIADGAHCDYAALRVAFRAKGRRLLLVSDAMPPVGGAAGSFAIGDIEITCRDGRCLTPSGKLAGSAVEMAGAVRNCVTEAGLSVEDVLWMATGGPATVLGEAESAVFIRAGAPADMVVLDSRLEVKSVISGGRYTAV